MKSFLLVLTFVLVSPVVSSAQFVVGQVVTVQADHDGIFTDFYDLIVDSNTVQTLPVASLMNNVISFPFMMPARGTHSLIVRARNIDDLFTDSDPTTFNVGKGKPNKPGKPRIVSWLLNAQQVFTSRTLSVTR